MTIQLLSDSIFSELQSAKLHLEKTNPELEYALTRFFRKLNQCNLIISRLNEEYTQQDIIEKKLFSKTETMDEKISDENDSNFQEYMTISSKISFDIEDFFIHSKIFLDRLSQILFNLITGLPEKTIGDFSKHRLHIIENSCGDKNYAQYIK